jgi:sterol desaturase/sphingolipid hydroxylase (fatty acid hydroxylase superfamily)
LVSCQRSYEEIALAGLLVLLTAFLLLLLGDFVATFGYHVPEHVFGRYHSIVHHSPNRSFVLYAIRTKKFRALVPGFLSAFPYLMFIPLLWWLSPLGVGLGLGLAQAHVIWRHQFSPNYKTPERIKKVCRLCGITTPERHRLHHRNARLAYGDVFAFYGKPAELWFKCLTRLKHQLTRQQAVN